MKREWAYESQGYELEAGGHYLPDLEIRLPNSETYFAEVKPYSFDKFDHIEYMDKLRRFTTETGIMILDGNPSCKLFDLAMHSHADIQLNLVFLQDYEPYVRCIDEYWRGYFRLDSALVRFFYRSPQ